uniref:Transglycosylase n=1 Tax=viral metagenome TaxID=1070528 RepID=A0A6M3JSB1_9ZZZZ
MIFTTTYEKDNPELLAQLREANKYLPWINEAATKFGLQPCVIAGLGSRESHWGLALNPEGPEGTGDFAKRKPKPPERQGTLPDDGRGFGRGLLQIDFDWHVFARTGKWRDPRENILYGCRVLADCLKRILEKISEEPLRGRFDYDFPLFLGKREHQIIRANLAAYNTGSARPLRDIKEGIDVDTSTSGHNYSTDVLSRAGWFQLQGWA